MRVAVFSDVHGYLSAFEAVLNHMDAQPGLDQIVFAGDLCLAGPRPKACLDLLRDRDIPSVVGNTDQWIQRPPPLDESLDGAERRRRNFVNATSTWTLNHLEPSDLTWLDELSDRFDLRISPTSDPANDLLIVHANPVDVDRIIFPPLEKQEAMYGRVRQPDAELEPLFQGVKARMIAFGHLHIPSQRRWRDKMLVNVSSVSIPGDGDPRAKYALFSWDKRTDWSAEHFFVPYSIDDEIVAFRQSEHPFAEGVAERLETTGYIAQNV